MNKARGLFRMAADLGSPVAQYYVGELLGRIGGYASIMLAMQKCAAEQGYGLAARSTAGYLKVGGNYNEAVKYYQLGAEAGHRSSASWLQHAFKGPPETEKLYYLGLDNDPERSSRYKLISQFIDRNEGRNPKVPDIDQIVPLPPAKLPEWDGTFQWQKERDAAVPPQQPSDELIDRLCKEKGLDPKTGLPLPAAATV